MRRPNDDALTPFQAMAEGFTIDDTCYPWFAYKGPRFRPTEYRECYTELEAELLQINKSVASHSMG